MKALVGAFNQEKALVGAFSVIVQPVVEPMDHYTALIMISLQQQSILASTTGQVGHAEEEEDAVSVKTLHSQA